MTTLSKEDVVRMARSGKIYDWFWLTEGIEEFDSELYALTEFATLARADLVAENERLNKQYLAAVNGRREFRKHVVELRDQLTEVQAENERLKTENTAFRKAWNADQLFVELRTALAAVEADNERLRLVIADIGQTLAWNSFGECRSYQSNSRLLSPKEADALAKRTLAQPRDDSALREMTAWVYEECAKACEEERDARVLDMSRITATNCAEAIRALAEKARHGS